MPCMVGCSGRGSHSSHSTQNNSPHFISQWASTEARARLELQAEGKLETPVFGVHYNSQKGDELETVWDEVSARQDGQEGFLELLV